MQHESVEGLHRALQRQLEVAQLLGQVGADDLPGVTPVGALEHDVGGKVDGAAVEVRDDHRR